MSLSQSLVASFAPIAQQLRYMSKLVGDEASENAKRAAVVLLAALREELSKPGTGKVYRIPVVKRDGTLRTTKRGKQIYRYHRASAPGEPPAVNTGELRRGTVMGLVGEVMRVGATANYAPYLERGTPRVKPRPFMAPALERVRKEMVDVVVTDMRLNLVKKNVGG